MTSLLATNVTKFFGGLAAVENVSLAISPGQIHALIGPNGSGKTTLLNILNGFYRIDRGHVSLLGSDISNLSVQQRARRGIARTFQKPRLLESISVLDNVMLGAWLEYDVSFPEAIAGLPKLWREEARLKRGAQDVLESLGLGRLAGRPAEALSHAEQKLTEIARGLMASPKYLLLDEPAGGLTEQEIERIGRVIQTIANAGIGILLVEHHTEFVFAISDHVTTLSLGKVIAEGHPEIVAKDPEVIRVYLGNG